VIDLYLPKDVHQQSPVSSLVEKTQMTSPSNACLDLATHGRFLLPEDWKLVMQGLIGTPSNEEAERESTK
jgi:hypothetical protein